MPSGSIIFAIGALCAVLASIRLFHIAAQRGWLPLTALGGHAGNQCLALTEVVRLDARRRLHLVRCADRRVLIMTGGGGDVVVGWLPGETT